MSKFYPRSLFILVLFIAGTTYAQQIRIPAPFKPGIDLTRIRQVNTSKVKRTGDHFKSVDAAVTCLSTYYADTNMVLDFSLRLAPSDIERGDSLCITFPAGITPLFSPNDSLIPATPGQEVEKLNPITDSTISWGINDNLTGGIDTGTTYYFSIVVSIAAGVSGPQIAAVHVSGDGVSNAVAADWNGIVTINEHTAGSNPDLVVTPTQFSRYFSVPAHHTDTLIFPAIVENKSAVLVAPKNLIFEDTLENFTDPHPIKTPLTTGEKDTIFSSKLYPQVIGLHLLTYFAGNLNDEDINDNFSASLFAITDSVFGRTISDTAFSIPLNGQSFTAGFGTWHELKTPDTLTTVSVFLKEPAIGARFSVSVHPFTSMPGNAVATSGIVTISSASADWYTVDFEPDVLLPAGRFFVSVNQLDTNSIGLGITNYNYLPNASFINFGAGWQTLESVDPAFTLLYFIQPNFGVSTYMPPADADLNISLHYPGGLFSVPLSIAEPYTLFADVGNKGADLNVNVPLNFSAEPGGFTAGGNVSPGLKMNEDTLIGGLTPFLPGATGEYMITVDAPLASDLNPSDNRDTILFIVSDTLLTRSNGQSFLQMPFGPGTDLSGGMLPKTNARAGTVFWLPAEDSLTTVSIKLAGAKVNDRYFASLHKVMNGKPDLSSALGFTDTVTTAAGQMDVVLPADSGRLLVKDSIYVMVHAITADNKPSAILISSGVYTPGADIIYYPVGMPEFEFITFETAGIEGAFEIKLGFGSYSGVGITENSYSRQVSVYPNPASGVVYIKNAGDADVKIFTVQGVLVKEEKISAEKGKIGIEGLIPGNYILNIIAGGQTAIKQLTITR